MFSFNGWKQQQSTWAPQVSFNILIHVPLFTCHTLDVPSKEAVTIRSLSDIGSRMGTLNANFTSDAYKLSITNLIDHLMVSLFILNSI